MPAIRPEKKPTRIAVTGNWLQCRLLAPKSPVVPLADEEFEALMDGVGEEVAEEPAAEELGGEGAVEVGDDDDDELPDGDGLTTHV